MKSSHSKQRDVQLISSKTEIHKHRNNIKEVLLWSNATAIRNFGDTGYMCSYCEEHYLQPADLKIHTLETHGDVQRAFFMTYDTKRFVVRLDITLLHCKICEQTIDTLEQLMNHLRIEHQKTIYTDIKNHIIPFKFASEKLECCICNRTFSKYKMLLQHMNFHYRNYICEICDQGFVNSMTFGSHKQTHNTGSYKCNHCNQIFDTLLKQKAHERAIHSFAPAVRKCGYCHESFTDYRKKEEHLAIKHGVKAPTVRCEACNKVCKDRQSLRIHIQRDHLLDRRFKCSECDKSFFSAGNLKDHMVKHTGIKALQCSVCSKAFSRAKNLKEHMKIHDDVRRFKCEHCEKAFVQKCSWRGHMRSKHGEIV